MKLLNCGDIVKIKKGACFNDDADVEAVIQERSRRSYSVWILPEFSSFAWVDEADITPLNINVGDNILEILESEQDEKHDISEKTATNLLAAIKNLKS